MGKLLSSVMSIQDLMTSYESSLSKLHEKPSKDPLKKSALYHLPIQSLALPVGGWKYVTVQVKNCVIIVTVLLTMLQGRSYAILASSCKVKTLSGCVTEFSMLASHHIATHIFFLCCNKAVFCVHTKPQGQLFLS
jgi:hypothetical protein